MTAGAGGEGPRRTGAERAAGRAVLPAGRSSNHGEFSSTPDLLDQLADWTAAPPRAPGSCADSTTNYAWVLMRGLHQTRDRSKRACGQARSPPTPASPTLFHSHRADLYDRVKATTGRRHLRVGHVRGRSSFDASWQPQLWLVDGHALHVADDETSPRPGPAGAVRPGPRHRLHRGHPVVPGPGFPARPTTARRRSSASAGRGRGGRPVGQDAQRYQPLRPHRGHGRRPGRPHGRQRDAAGRPPGGQHPRVRPGRGLRPVAPGVTGELYPAGAGLARGYLNPARPDRRTVRGLTLGAAGRACTAPATRPAGLSDGRLDYQGRADGPGQGARPPGGTGRDRGGS